MRQAYDAAGRIIDDLGETYARVKAVWEVSRVEKGRSVGGRHFVHIMDDVKDHGADRRADLTYLVVNEQRMDLPGWRKQLGEIIRAYSQAVGVAARIDSPHE